MANERYQQNSHKWQTWPPLTVGLPVTSERYWASFQVTRLFHKVTVSQCDHFFAATYVFVVWNFTRLITRLKSFFLFFLTSIWWGSPQLQCIYYLRRILISKPPRVFRRIKRRSCLHMPSCIVTLMSKLNQYWIKMHRFLSQKCIWKWFCTILTFSSRPQYVKFKIIDIYMYHHRNTGNVFLITSDDITSNSTVAILGQVTSNWASAFRALFHKGSRDSLWKN